MLNHNITVKHGENQYLLKTSSQASKIMENMNYSPVKEGKCMTAWRAEKGREIIKGSSKMQDVVQVGVELLVWILI